jgi:hypothetical protein
MQRFGGIDEQGSLIVGVTDKRQILVRSEVPIELGRTITHSSPNEMWRLYAGWRTGLQPRHLPVRLPEPLEWIDTMSPPRTAWAPSHLYCR